MMVDVFSSFDPALNRWGSRWYFWVWSFVPVLLFFSFFWSRYSSYLSVTLILLMFMSRQVNRTTLRWVPMSHVFLCSLFSVLLLLNLMGLIPYVFSTTSHLVLTLSFGFPFWLGLIMSGVVWSPTSFLASLLPAGAPGWLNPFLVIVEMISIFVRPLTLSFRLAANMSAGHIVMILLSFYMGLCFSLGVFSGLGSLLVVLWGYIMFEMGISLIQAYIFCLLLSLYANDHPLK